MPLSADGYSPTLHSARPQPHQRSLPSGDGYNVATCGVHGDFRQLLSLQGLYHPLFHLFVLRVELLVNVGKITVHPLDALVESRQRLRAFSVSLFRAQTLSFASVWLIVGLAQTSSPPIQDICNSQMSSRLALIFFSVDKSAALMVFFLAAFRSPSPSDLALAVPASCSCLCLDPTPDYPLVPHIPSAAQTVLLPEYQEEPPSLRQPPV